MIFTVRQSSAWHFYYFYYLDLSVLRVVGLVLAIFFALSAAAWSETEYLVDPAGTDAEIGRWLAPHVVVIDRDAVPLDLLYVHLPGSRDVPASSRRILHHGAALGYPAIGLRYPNSWAVFNLCTSSGDARCFEDVRLEIIDGIDRTDLVDVGPADCITNRLQRLLVFLAGAYPDDGWARFLDRQGEVEWSKVVLSGHSQGAGHAVMLAKIHRVARVGLLAGPTDYSNSFDRPADWLAKVGLTPAEDHWGFGHVDDTLVPEDHLLAIWRDLGMGAFGEAVTVDATSPPYDGSHMLFTAAESGFLGGLAAHASVVIDLFTPTFDDGSARFGVVWETMLFPEGVAARRGAAFLRPGRRVMPR
jgi:hypothetical protein